MILYDLQEKTRGQLSFYPTVRPITVSGHMTAYSDVFCVWRPNGRRTSRCEHYLWYILFHMIVFVVNCACLHTLEVWNTLSLPSMQIQNIDKFNRELCSGVELRFHENAAHFFLPNKGPFGSCFSGFWLRLGSMCHFGSLRKMLKDFGLGLSFSCSDFLRPCLSLEGNAERT